jgi:hypothetical protein
MNRPLAAALGLLLAACEGPPVFPGADRRQNQHAARVEGTVVVSSAARGDVVVLLYDAARPPPPTGTGRPVTFTVVPAATVFGAAAPGSLGPFTAPFTFPLVAPGRYLVRGFIDANRDFVPWYSVTAEVNLGDVGGAAVDAVTRLPRVVEVGRDADGEPVPVLDLPVSYSDALKVPWDRPAFEASAPGLTLDGGVAAVVLTALPFLGPVVNEAVPMFQARLVDDDGDGVPDDANRDGVPDFWPRVVVRKLSADSVLLDENDLDKNGVLDTAEGFADYAHQAPDGGTLAADGAPDLVVLAAGFDFASLLPQLLDSGGRVKATPTPVASLRLVIQYRAFDASSAAPALLRAVPRGTYAVTVIQSSGQTWRLPNELAPGLAEPLGLPPVASQAFLVTVP